MMINTYSLVYTICLFLGVVSCLKIGHVFGKRQRPHDKETEGGGALAGAVFALLGLLLAFSFSNALTKYGEPRNLLTREANSIADIYTKLDLLPDAEQAVMRPLLREYAEVRLQATQALMGSEAEKKALAASQEKQDEIWRHIATFVKSSGNGAINSHLIVSFDNVAAAPDDQRAEQRNNQPEIIYILIFVLALSAALLAGYGMADRPKLPIIRVVIFSISVTITMYVIIDLESPGTGFFNSVPSNEMLQVTIDNMQ